MSLRAALSASTVKYSTSLRRHCTTKMGHKRLKKTRTRSSPRTNHRSSKRPACRELGKCPKRTELLQWLAFPSPQAVVSSSLPSTPTWSKENKKEARKQEQEQKWATATTSATKMLYKELPFVSKDERQHHKRTTTTGRRRKRGKKTSND